MIPIPHVAPGGPISEHDFQEQLRRALCAVGRATRVWRQNSGSVVTRDRSGRATGRFQAGPPTGAADLSGIAGPNGLRLEVEVKVDHEHTAEQVVFGEMINRLGGVYVLVRYSHALTLAENVELGVKLVDEAINRRASHAA